MADRPLRLSPSDFAFLWEQCKRCFYLKVVHNIRQPSMPMAGIFKKIEGLQMGQYEGKPTAEAIPGLPPGHIRCGERIVESEPVKSPFGREWFIYGKTDSLLEFEDGSWGIMDFKTTQIKPEKARLYGRQLHAYAYALQNPAARPRILKTEAPRLEPITRLGLLCFEPSGLVLEGVERQVYSGNVSWIEIPIDPDGFLASVEEMMVVLSGDIPAPTPDCDWCSYARTMKTTAFESSGGGNGGDGGGSGSGDEATTVPDCPKCGSPMKERKGKYGRFFGCTQFPDCRGTRRISE